MPGHDKTGPFGEGPLTGRRFGLCAGNDISDRGTPFGNSSGFGRRFFRGNRSGSGSGRRPGFGRGTGFRKGLADQLYPDDRNMMDEVDLIKSQLKTLEDQLSRIIKRTENE